MTSTDSSHKPARRRDRDRTRSGIIAAATKEFSDKGYAGARVDDIAERTHTTKRMLYYYFGDKEGLYQAVLEDAYLTIRARERTHRYREDDPVAAVRELAELTFDHHDRNPDFIRLVCGENLLRGAHMKKSESLRNLGNPALDVLSRILTHGREQGIFRPDVDPLDVHLLISSFCFFRVANRHTWKALFNSDPAATDNRQRQRALIGDVVVAFLTDKE